MGRCYGDSALSDTILSTTDFNQIISFDVSTGILICQSGITLDAILNTIVPAGWFLPVTPGTKFVSIGGAVAANIHGKNHHLHGSLSHHLQYIDVLTSDGTIIRCSPDEQSDLFYMTCGGMGLTGIIVEVAIKLIPISSSYIRQKPCAQTIWTPLWIILNPTITGHTRLRGLFVWQQDHRLAGLY